MESDINTLSIRSERISHPTRSSQAVASSAGRGAILNFAALLIRHTIVQDSTFDPYLFDPRPYGKRI